MLRGKWQMATNSFGYLISDFNNRCCILPVNHIICGMKFNGIAQIDMKIARTI